MQNKENKIVKDKKMNTTIALLEYVGIFAFSISGANVAISEQLDLLGIYILATVTAMGGGIIRDVVVSKGVPAFFNNRPAIIIILLSTTLAIVLKGQWKYKTVFAFIDALGLAAFAISAGLKGLHEDYSMILFLFVSSITGVGGGMLRDMIVNRKPDVFCKEIYCMACIGGEVVLWLLWNHVPNHLATGIALCTIVGIRMICYFKNVHLPTIEIDKPKKKRKKKKKISHKGNELL